MGLTKEAGEQDNQSDADESHTAGHQLLYTRRLHMEVTAYLFELVTLRKISQALMGRIHRNYRFIVAFNLMLIVLGVAGVIQPTTSALLHNASTLGISLDSMTDLLDKEKE